MENNFPVIDLLATGKRIEQLRKLNKYSVKQLQEYFSFTAPQSIYKWQRGETLPDISNLLALAKLFNCTIEEILVYHD